MSCGKRDSKRVEYLFLVLYRRSLPTQSLCSIRDGLCCVGSARFWRFYHVGGGDQLSCLDDSGSNTVGCSGLWRDRK
jgi:hypothetical protein